MTGPVAPVGAGVPVVRSSGRLSVFGPGAGPVPIALCEELIPGDPRTGM